MEERIKAEDAELRKEQKRKILESGAGGRKKYSSMSARYLEEGADDEGQYDSTSLSNVKRGEGKKRRDSDEDSAEEDRRYQRARRERDDPEGEMDDFIVNEEDESDSDEYDNNNSPQKTRIKRKASEVKIFIDVYYFTINLFNFLFVIDGRMMIMMITACLMKKLRTPRKAKTRLLSSEHLLDRDQSEW